VATVKQYTLNLWRFQKTVCRKLGMDPSRGTDAEKAQIISGNVLTAVLIKILTDKGVMTDAELNAAYTAVAGADFPVLRTVLPEPGEGEPDDPDLGV
jgi:hypothetical protein